MILPTLNFGLFYRLLKGCFLIPTSRLQKCSPKRNVLPDSSSPIFNIVMFLIFLKKNLLYPNYRVLPFLSCYVPGLKQIFFVDRARLTSCPNDKFLCVSDGRCLENDAVCDGTDDCIDASDESPGQEFRSKQEKI